MSWVQGRQGQGQGPRVGPNAWGLGDAIDNGRHGAGAMPRRQWQAQGGCVAEWSQNGGARPKVATGAMPKAVRQRLYNVIIQTCIAFDRARGDAGDSGMYRARVCRC